MPRTRFGLALRCSTVAIALALSAPSCKPSIAPGEEQAAHAGDWAAWRDLSPLVEVAQSHAPQPALAALRDAAELLRQDKPKSADRRLAQAANAAGRDWVAVARADVAALNFTVCIRGVAWRLVDGPPPSPTDREMDYSPDTRLEPGDVSVEALLTNLETAVKSEIPALVTQARIARVRVAAFAQKCAANDEVAGMAAQTVEADLATLAAENRLTPDLAYLWAGVQMNRFSGSAARPFLLKAKEGGFDHPAVTFMLAVVALEERDLEQAEAMAKDAAAAFGEIESSEGAAQAWFVRGEVERMRAQSDPSRTEVAQGYYDKSLELDPTYVPAVFTSATLDLAAGREDAAITKIQSSFEGLIFTGPLDEALAQEASRNLQSLVILAEEPAVVQLTRDALLDSIDDEADATRRGLRYFYAAALDARLQNYELAHGHGVLAKDEFEESGILPVDVQTFLDRVRPR